MEWKGSNTNELPDPIRFAATGGQRVTPERLFAIRQMFMDVAQANGFGSSTRRSSLATFDADLSAALATDDVMDSGEALRDDVWSFFGVVLAPDLVHWRFGQSEERYFGGIRNTFQRLWVRGRALDRGSEADDRWLLLRELTEDALVQITERPSIAADRVLSLALGEAWLRAARRHGKGQMEPVMRRAVLLIRIRNEVRALCELPPAALMEALDEAFGL